MSTYLTEVASQKKYVGNVVMKINGQYFAIRKPDSGLVIAAPFDRCIQSLILNPTSIDLRRVTTTIASYSFKIVDKYGVVTAMVLGDGAPFMNAQVEIWLGRTDVAMSFADYYKLPITRINKMDHTENAYNFASTEETERMDRPIYRLKSALSVDILSGTTTLTMRDSIDDFPATGYLKIEDEFMSYTGKSDVLKRFTGVVRGELSSTPAAHSANTDALQSETVTANPITLLLQILISGGGGGAYDVLDSGLGIDPTLIDLTEIEALRTDLFTGVEFRLGLYNIESALKFIEEQILMPCNLRFTYSRSSKISLAILDKAVFVDTADLIDEDTISSYPKWTVDGNKIANRLEIQWDYDEVTNTYGRRTVSEDAASIAAYGAKTALKYDFKGIKEDLDGETIITEFADRLLARLSVSTPEVQMNTHVDKSLQTIGDKTLVESSQIPSVNGTLNFASEMEIVSRSINFQTGDVQFKLAFTSFTNIRSCYIAPCSEIITVISQKKVTLAAGRGDLYSVGWKLRLWDMFPLAYADAQINEIESISGDDITFVDNFTTTLTGPGDMKLKFANYDECAESQKRYCFISDAGLNFGDGKPTYKVTY